MGEQATGAVRQIHGSCHCGNVSFTFDWPGGDGFIPVRACSCTFCQKHRGVWTSHPEGLVKLSVGDPARVQRYRFGTGTADFHICTECGVAPIVTSEIDDSEYAVVNVHCFDDVDRADLEESATDFEGESTEDRLARRKRNWSPFEALD